MFRRILVGDNERVFVIRKRRFAGILAPGEYWIFTFGRGVELERHNTKQLILASDHTNTLARQFPELAARYFTVIETGESQVALVYLDRRLSRVIPSATRVLYFKGALEVAFTLIDVRAEPDELLAEKVDLDETVSAQVRREMELYGVRVSAIALKDIILPGDIREILNQVVTAEKQAQANLIRRREETGPTRSLLNTAKLMEDNPLLVRMKELEVHKKIAE